MKRREYIPTPAHWNEMFVRISNNPRWTPEAKVPIDKIRIDKKYFEFRNDIDPNHVLDMLVNFDQELWMPVTVNRDYFLLDGQHRLAVAKQMCLKFVDVLICEIDAEKSKRIVKREDAIKIQFFEKSNQQTTHHKFL